jgi:hypothetical protein
MDIPWAVRMCSRFVAKPASSLAKAWLQNRHWKGDALCSPSLSEAFSALLQLLQLLLLLLVRVVALLSSIFLSIFSSNKSTEIGGKDAMRRLILYTLL